MSFDKRLTPTRPDLAAAFLQGRVEASRFVEGEKLCVVQGRAGLRAAPSPDAAQDSELLYGESVIAYERKAGWAWVQAARDHYVGYVRDDALAGPFVAAPGAAPIGASVGKWRVCALMTPVYAGPNLETPVRDLLPLNAVVTVGAQEGDYRAIAPGAFVHHRHLAPLTQWESDFASVAERFVGVPYVWGGRTAAGLDCSGLVQMSLAAAGINAPRDTDMLEKHFAQNAGTPRRGDLVFWKGHMGLMLDETRLLHANAFHMMVAIEPLSDAVARIAKELGPVTAMKRV